MYFLAKKIKVLLFEYVCCLIFKFYRHNCLDKHNLKNFKLKLINFPKQNLISQICYKTNYQKYPWRSSCLIKKINYHKMLVITYDA